MTEEIIIAGFGGQGVLTLGTILAYSGIMEGQEVSWFPSYGPEMRGGTANVTVILSEERISSPILTVYDTAIIFNQQSMDKFEKTVKPGGLLIYDDHAIIRPPKREDINIYIVSATKEATQLGNPKIANMVMLGGFLKIKPLIKFENVIAGLKKALPERYHHLLPLNEQAIKRGMEIVKPVQVLDSQKA